jgi:hypothetical protein
MSHTITTCTHRHIGPEFILGSRTGDRQCSHCGETWAPRETLER